MKRQIEIEYRAKLSKEKHDSLHQFLYEKGEKLGEDDKNVFFFIMENKLLKVTNNISKNNAKITLKLNEIGKGAAFEEIEFPISNNDVSKAVFLFKELGFIEVQESFQKRENFIYKDVEIALKYSEMWKHHIELEIIISDESQKDLADKKIKNVADELGVIIMTEEELIKFTKSKNEQYNDDTNK